jgi:hypothetical protein
MPHPQGGGASERGGHWIGRLVLQLLLLAFLVMSLGGCVLMTPSPEGPTENKDEIESRLEQDPGEQRADFWHGRHEIRQ